MSNITVEVLWGPPFEFSKNPIADLRLVCDNGYQRDLEFVGPENGKQVIELPQEASICKLVDLNFNSNVAIQPLDRGCQVGFLANEEQVCAYSATDFDVGVSMLTGTGLVLLAALVLVVGLAAAKLFSRP